MLMYFLNKKTIFQIKIHRTYNNIPTITNCGFRAKNKNGIMADCFEWKGILQENKGKQRKRV